jgi:hypothetical protein
MEVRLLAVRSIVRDRGRAIAVVAALTASVALTSAPAAFGAVDGDPIASSTFTFKLSSGFKKQLKQNGVKMKPKKLKLTKGDVDPTTGAADVRFGKVTFKKGSKKFVFNNLKGSMPGKVKANEGAIFKLTAPKVARNGFGADLTGVKVKLLKGAAKKINKALDLHSLHKSTAGSFSLSYQPKTVKVLSGQADVLPSLSSGSVASKIGAHCIPLIGGVTPVAPATQTNPPAGAFHFPVAGGTISPAGNDGVVNQLGGLKLVNAQTGIGVPPSCASTELHSLLQQNLSTLLASNQIQADVVISIPPPAPLGGPKGVAFAATIDPAGPPPATVKADPAAHQVTTSGGIIKITDTSAKFLNLVFPQPSSSFSASSEFAAGDLFGTPTLTVNTR